MVDREKLATLIEKEGGTNWWKPDLFETSVLPHLPRELEVVEHPPQEEVNYNCFVFALGLQNDPYFLGGENPIQKEFIRHLLSIGTLTALETPKARNLVFYEDSSGAITHGGIMESDHFVLSKWMWGPTIRHELWDIPASFGDSVFYTNKPEMSAVKDVYRKYRDSGVYIPSIR